MINYNNINNNNVEKTVKIVLQILNSYIWNVFYANPLIILSNSKVVCMSVIMIVNRLIHSAIHVPSAQFLK